MNKGVDIMCEVGVPSIKLRHLLKTFLAYPSIFENYFNNCSHQHLFLVETYLN